ncbi:hypothetical protein C0J08_12810 [Marinomonas sp. CT5]|uniref:hypothetical protein n=1 Tax=Marinomonas sp. CT5 TaxID=2066133 RepID=UPI001BB057AA|nr:hypothetical protein [Marinomonas sp. CT5]QUX96219.1 hypothetical protein C0J08_12810 [Marinomonas sp. CT5]
MAQIMESNDFFEFDFGESAKGKAPKADGYYKISEYISFMQSVESDNEADSTNTELMLTKFRKMFYNSLAWNDLLIPETKGIPAFSSSPNIDKLSANHEVILSNNELYDIAHIFAILDASNHNGPFAPVSESIIKSRIWPYLKHIMPVVHDRKMAAGWLGDLSEIAGEFFISKSETHAQKQEVVNQYGAYYKTLANVDGMIISGSKSYDISAKSGLKVSDIFNDYFGSATTEGQREKRHGSMYLDYASSIGLTGWNGSSFSNQAVWLEDQKKNLRTCTAFFIIKARGVDTKAFDLEALKKDLAFLAGHSLCSDLERVFAKFLLDEISDKATPLDNDILTISICFLTWIGFYDKKLSIEKLLSSYVRGLIQAIVNTTDTK